MESEADTETPPAGKSSINPEDWRTVLDQIENLESDRVAITAVLYYLQNQRLSVQQDIIMLDEKHNNLKTDAKYSIIERLELLEDYIHSLKIRFNTLEMTVDANVYGDFSDANRASLQ